MNINFTVLTPGLSNKIYRIVEHTWNVLTNVVFQMVWFVLDTFWLEVILRVVRSAVYNVRYV